MQESEQNALLDALKMHVQTAKETQFFIYNSLLTFNGILISAFAIIISIDANKYKPYIPVQFFLSLISVLGILVIMCRIRVAFRSLSFRLFAKICRDNWWGYQQYNKQCMSSMALQKLKTAIFLVYRSSTHISLLRDGSLITFNQARQTVADKTCATGALKRYASGLFLYSPLPRLLILC